MATSGVQSGLGGNELTSTILAKPGSVIDSSISNIGSQAGSQVGSNLGSNVGSQAGSYAGSGYDSSVGSAVGSNLGSAISGNPRRAILIDANVSLHQDNLEWALVITLASPRTLVARTSHLRLARDTDLEFLQPWAQICPLT